jgi:hypothetical protein
VWSVAKPFLVYAHRESGTKERNFPERFDNPTGIADDGDVVSARTAWPGPGCLADYVSVAGQPSRRVGWGATARAGGGLPAAVADPVGPRVGSVPCRGCRSSLTELSWYATITFDPRSGMVLDRRIVWSSRSDRTSRGIAQRVEELRLPRNRMGGQGKRVRIAVTPRREAERATA